MESLGLKNILKAFKDKKVFITGHTGFKGSWLTYLLDKSGAKTKGYSLKPNTSPSLFDNLNLSQNHTSVYADIKNYDFLKIEIQSFKPDFVFHLAAQALVLDSYSDPKETFEVNFNGTLNLLEVLRVLNFSCTAILITTDKVYENIELNKAFREIDKLGGKDPYSSSKAACELLIHSYNTSFFNKTNVKIASVRAGNVIGGGDWSKNRLIPDIVRSIFENKDLDIRNPYSTRPWQHVLEPISGYLKLALLLDKNSNKYSGSWNFGPELDDVKSVNEIINLAKKFGIHFDLNVLKNKNKMEAKFLSLDIEKAKTELNWKPKWKTEKAILETFKWYQKFYAGERVNELIDDNFNKFNE
jgi:CDP-glucose 4,6-dehydratase